VDRACFYLMEAPQSDIAHRHFARETTDGLIIAVRLTPKAARDQITGLETGADGLAHLAARVTAVPEKGKANAALANLIADWLGVPKSQCEVVGGGKSRLKQMLVRGDSGKLKRQLHTSLARLQSGE
jgi:uncharacterized protein (TIGR00251 family)